MIHLQAFARYRTAGLDKLDLPCPRRHLGALLEDPAWRPAPEALLAVNATFANRDAVLKDGDDVALMPPVSGG